MESVRADVASASVVIQFVGDPERFIASLVNDEAIREVLSIYEPTPARSLGSSVDSADPPVPSEIPRSRTATAISEAMRRADFGLWRLSGGQLDLKVLLPIASAASSAALSRRPLPTPLWLTLGMFAFNTFVALNGKRVDGKPL